MVKDFRQSMVKMRGGVSTIKSAKLLGCVRGWFVYSGLLSSYMVGGRELWVMFFIIWLSFRLCCGLFFQFLRSGGFAAGVGVRSEK
jgi:hypothetical protein